MKAIIKPLACLLVIVGSSAIRLKASDDVDPALQQMHQEITTKARITARSGDKVFATGSGPLRTVDVQSPASRFKAILAGEDFSATAGAALRIGMCADIVQRLTPALRSKVPRQSDQESELLDAVKQFMTKVSSNIDEQWTFQKGSANVAPPPGVPNAAAGMNPDAISDPQLRKEYLAKIEAERAKQSKNNQQTGLRRAREKLLWAAVGLMPSSGQAGWTRTDLIEHFAKDDKSRAILDDYLRKAGRVE